MNWLKKIMRVVLGPDCVAPGYVIEQKNDLFQVRHIDSGCTQSVDSLRQGRRASWDWKRQNVEWKEIEKRLSPDGTYIPPPIEQPPPPPSSSCVYDPPKLLWVCHCGTVRSYKTKECDDCLDTRPSVIPSIASDQSVNKGETP